MRSGWKTVPYPELPSARIADSLEANWVHIATGDLVSRGEEMAKVVACAAERGELFVVCDPLAIGGLMVIVGGEPDGAGGVVDVPRPGGIGDDVDAPR